MLKLQSVWIFVKSNMLFFAMMVGIVVGVLEKYGLWLWHAPEWVIPVLLFSMLFFSFCKVNPLELRIYKWHIVLMCFQIVGCLLLYFCLRPFSSVLAQGMLLCVLMPTATAAPIVAAKLGGSIPQLTTYVLLSNIMTALLVPLIFPVIYPALEITYSDRFIQIILHISPLLFGPFFAAWAVRIIYDATMRVMHKDERFHLSGGLSQLPFYLWTCLITILIARTTHTLLTYNEDRWPVLWLMLGSFMACLAQFFLGRYVGGRLPQQQTKPAAQVTAGQALGQKNTALAIWMAHAWLHPLVALAPATYIIWQNIFNSWQLFQAGRGQKSHG